MAMATQPSEKWYRQKYCLFKFVLYDSGLLMVEQYEVVL